MPGQVVILMGSKSDLDHVRAIGGQLEAFGIPYVMRVASAHKSVRHLMDILESYRDADQPTVFVAVAGRSNALAGMADANTPWPVVTCPPVSSTFGGADIYSSLRMPSGVAPMVVLDPKGAALAAAKILAVHDDELRQRIVAYQSDMVDGIIAADRDIQ
jgi:phosphoribosylaminoimidazole carboxylase PurE protein